LLDEKIIADIVDTISREIEDETVERINVNANNSKGNFYFIFKL
jgi:hypothetical protein